MAHFFLSYSRRDEEVALRLAADLRRAGVDIWIDQHKIKPSDHWDRSVEAGLRDSAGVVMVMSERSAASENVLDEIAVALDSGKQVIPVLIEPCQPPLRLARVQFIDATQDYEGALARCAQAITAALEKAGASETAPSPTPLAAPFLDALAGALTPFLGPISRHLVEDEARLARTKPDLIARVAARIPDNADRTRFLAAAKDLAG